VRRGDAVGHAAGGQLPAVRPPGAAHGADPPPLRGGRLAGDHRDHPLLDRRRAVHRAGARHLLRRLRVHRGARLTGGRPVLVYGLGVTGQAVARALAARGAALVLGDDRETAAAVALAAELGAPLATAPGPAEAERLLAGVAAVAPAPGVPEHHPVVAG